jgi:hypothetical protein
MLQPLKPLAAVAWWGEPCLAVPGRSPSAPVANLVALNNRRTTASSLVRPVPGLQPAYSQPAQWPVLLPQPVSWPVAALGPAHPVPAAQVLVLACRPTASATHRQAHALVQADPDGAPAESRSRGASAAGVEELRSLAHGLSGLVTPPCRCATATLPVLDEIPRATGPLEQTKQSGVGAVRGGVGGRAGGRDWGARGARNPADWAGKAPGARQTKPGSTHV